MNHAKVAKQAKQQQQQQVMLGQQLHTQTMPVKNRQLSRNVAASALPGMLPHWQWRQHTHTDCLLQQGIACWLGKITRDPMVLGGGKTPPFRWLLAGR